MKQLLILFFIVISLAGCREKPATKFIHSDILQESNPRHFVLADIVKSEYPDIASSLSDLEYELVISYIVPETTGESLFGIVRHSQLFDEGIIISDTESMLLFDRNGRFIWKVCNQGRGPGEYSSIGNIAVDRWRKEIIISCSEFGHHYIYDYYGQFVEHIDLSPAKGVFLEVIDSATYLVQSGTHYANPWAWVVSRGGIVHNTFSEHDSPAKIYDDGRGSSFIAQRKIREFLNGYYLWQSDTVWYFDSRFTEKKAILTIDSRIKDKDSEMIHPVYKVNVRTGGKRKRHYVYDIGFHHESLLYLSYFFLQRTLLYDTSNGTFFGSPSEGYNDDTDYGPPVHDLPGTTRPHISVIYPHEILKLDQDKIRKESDLYKIYSTIKPEDNPVIRIIYRK